MHEHLEIFPVFNLNLGTAAIQLDYMKLKPLLDISPEQSMEADPLWAGSAHPTCPGCSPGRSWTFALCPAPTGQAGYQSPCREQGSDLWPYNS